MSLIDRNPFGKIVNYKQQKATLSNFDFMSENNLVFFPYDNSKHASLSFILLPLPHLNILK